MSAGHYRPHTWRATRTATPTGERVTFTHRGVRTTGVPHLPADWSDRADWSCLDASPRHRVHFRALGVFTRHFTASRSHSSKGSPQ